MNKYLFLFFLLIQLTSAETIILVICYNRPLYLERTLKSIQKNYPTGSVYNSLKPKLVVSQDGTNPHVELIAKKYTSFHWTFHHPSTEGYGRLARHYGFALNRAFKEADRVIVIEDDLELAIDFFDFMAAVKDIVDKDERVLCASAFNDHGQRRFVQGASPDSIIVSDFFSGLGWMISKRVWREYEPIWPTSYWDDWLRKNRKGRYTIRPEISRSITFGEKGVSNGQFYNQYLSTMVLNTEKVQFPNLNVDQLIYKLIAEFKISTKIGYISLKDYERLARQIGIIDDIKFDVPRGAFRGIVPLFINRKRVFLYPVNYDNRQLDARKGTGSKLI